MGQIFFTGGHNRPVRMGVLMRVEGSRDVAERSEA